ncbi:hypothetical protein FNV43_RR19253 [Rhamnella rubrinervis]|uniref:Uncharacterized protein n=1 Tax=Rhamnella rubrinervis TaxID=2594499 RepID=A0A8K0GTP4_9ROSA|nr:hypothetical protein FNV43_RR19253 [Rhamnella rubrinervis]
MLPVGWISDNEFPFVIVFEEDDVRRAPIRSELFFRGIPPLWPISGCSTNSRIARLNNSSISFECFRHSSVRVSSAVENTPFRIILLLDPNLEARPGPRELLHVLTKWGYGQSNFANGLHPPSRSFSPWLALSTSVYSWLNLFLPKPSLCPLGYSVNLLSRALAVESARYSSPPTIIVLP